MNNEYLNIYNNLVNLTRNKNLYKTKNDETFSDRLIILLFHFFFLQIYKKEILKVRPRNYLIFL